MEFIRVVKSVLWAMIGVQKKENLRHDFSKSSATPFIVAGIIMVLFFLITIWAVVKMVLSNT